MLFRCLLLLFVVTAICAQKGGRQSSASEGQPSLQRPSSRSLANRKTAQPSEPIQQAQEPEQDREPDEDRDVVAARRPSRPRPQPRPPSSPQPAEEEGHEPAPEPYSFSYSVDDAETGASSAREETQDANGEIVGFYHIKDAEGRTRRVDYTAGKDGFKATIKSNEEGLTARAPADVNIELSASPSERVQSYAPNNRPLASESSIKSFGRPTQDRFFRRLIIPSPTPASPQQPLEQTSDGTQISQTLDSGPNSDITQQRNVDEEELPLQSAPVKGPAPVPPPSRPIAIETPVRPVGAFHPQRIQTFREQGSVGVQALRYVPQLREENPNSIQDVQQKEVSAPAPSSPQAATKAISARAYPQLRPLSSILGSANIPGSPTISPQFTQYFHRTQTAGAAQPQSIPNFVPFNPPSNNIVFQSGQQRDGITQQQLLEYIHPIEQPQNYVFEAPAPTPIQLELTSLDNSGISYAPQQPNDNYRLVVQHREFQQQQRQPHNQEFVTQEKVSEEPEPQQEEQVPESRSETQVPNLSPPPSPTFPIRQPIIEYRQYRPLPELQNPIAQQQRQVFEPQVYEPRNQQSYEPLQQEQADEPQEESRAASPTAPICDCAKQQQNSESRVQAVKGQPSAPTGVKSGRLSPARNINAFIPQTIRT